MSGRKAVGILAAMVAIGSTSSMALAIPSEAGPPKPKKCSVTAPGASAPAGLELSLLLAAAGVAMARRRDPSGRRETTLPPHE